MDLDLFQNFRYHDDLLAAGSRHNFRYNSSRYNRRYNYHNFRRSSHRDILCRNSNHPNYVYLEDPGKRRTIDKKKYLKSLRRFTLILVITVVDKCKEPSWNLRTERFISFINIPDLVVHSNDVWVLVHQDRR